MNADLLAMGDGRTFGQAVRALDKLVAELGGAGVPDPGSPIRRAYERIANGTYAGGSTSSGPASAAAA